MEKGCIFWITGLSGSGKSTVSTLFHQRLKTTQQNVLLLDGDQLRSVLGLTSNYSYEDRKKIALTYCRLCKMLAEQGSDVVIATISMFHECHDWNRKNQTHYYEVYLNVPLDILKKRNPKMLYSSPSQSIVGLDIPQEEPQKPDLIIHNHGDISPQKAVDLLWENSLTFRAKKGTCYV